MPSLKDLHCFIELPDGKTQLHEFGTAYGDGCVETFVAVPGRPQPFAIRLSSSKFIAPGLAMYVFIDGVYQCNRNRQNLKLRKPLDRKSFVDFVVRQKEERQDDGTMIARDWNFERLDIVSANEAPEACSPGVLENLGCIEVVVLRCAGMRSAKSADNKVKPMNLDGAGDMPDHHFSLDGAPNSPEPQYDDRAYEYMRGGGRYGAPTMGPSHLHSGPPPPLSSGSYARRPKYTSPVRQTSDQVHDILRSPENLVSSIQYGSVPVPHQSRVASMHAPAPSVQGGAGPNLPFDPRSLDRTAPPPPPLPVGPLGPQSPSQNTHVSWDQHLPQPSTGWNDQNGWESGEETRSCSRNTGDTWDLNQHENRLGGWKPSEYERELIPMSWGAPETHAPWPTARTTRTGHWAHPSDLLTSRSRPSESVWESKIDGDGWTHIEASSESSGSWALPVHPSESISHVAGPSTIAPALSQTPSVNELSSKLLSLKEDEGTRRRSVATNPAVSLNRTTRLHGGGFSTFEKSVRNAFRNDKTIPTWEGNRAPVAPTVWAAAEKKTSPQGFWNQSTPFGKGHEKKIYTSSDKTVHGSKGQKETFQATGDNGWGVKDRVGSSGGWPLVTEQEYQPVMDDWTVQKLYGHTAKETSWEQPTKPKNVVANDDSWQADVNGWSAPQEPRTLANEPNPWTKDAASKDQPLKTRLSKYRQLRSPATETGTIRHRQFPPPGSERSPKAGSRKECMEAEPLLKVLREDAARKGIEHQVRAGKGAKYGHAIGRPEYLDSLEKPYAVFRFKYRDHGNLRKLLGKNVVPSDAALLTTSPIDPRTVAQPTTLAQIHDVKQQLKKVPKEALIDGLLDLQTKLEKKKKKIVAPTDTAGMNRTRDWVKRQSREASVNGKKTEARRSGGSWSSDDGWH
ncbi:uncharacterized protein N0V89_011529 [Didymosphaeria variabile]|uniref:Uncharacterized protein n=1 Tax=Didymosphaeria variabile TaxID=1932322 RepID=A0A9W8XAD4_9PLEO|nr:uncharacterized protein N0V89_011529 [Didymosphaeria variabile]KAJ4345399.1 hypothetical protein N0V89_011529 [Didymosphaeria variabile]